MVDLQLHPGRRRTRAKYKHLGAVRSPRDLAPDPPMPGRDENSLIHLQLLCYG
jgi:hypothetical protein